MTDEPEEEQEDEESEFLTAEKAKALIKPEYA